MWWIMEDVNFELEFFLMNWFGVLWFCYLYLYIYVVYKILNDKRI